MNAKLSLTFGALADPLHKQIGVPKKACLLYQRLADSLTFLSVHQFVRESEKRRMRQRLMDLIAQDERPEFVAAFRRRATRGRGKSPGGWGYLNKWYCLTHQRWYDGQSFMAPPKSCAPLPSPASPQPEESK